MIPIGEHRRSRLRGLALVTLGLIAINVLVFLHEVALGARAEGFISTYGAVPREILTGQDVPPPGPHPLWIQLLTSLFLHGGWLHLIGNMLYLYVFGRSVEDTLGATKYLLFYLTAGIAATLTHIFLTGPRDIAPSIGASGAIAAVLGAYLIWFPRRQVYVVVPILFFATLRVSALVLLGFWFILQFLDGVAAIAQGAVHSSGIAVWAHIGGFAIGAIVALLLRSNFPLRRPAYR